MSVQPTRIDFAIDGAGGASVDNPDLATLLIRDQATGLSLLRQVGASISVEEISVDCNGRILIDNAEFRRYVLSMVNNPVGAVGQGICGAGCAGV